MRPLKGLTSMANPKDLYDKYAKLFPAISVFVGKISFSVF
jgi:hypothetical protein